MFTGIIEERGAVREAGDRLVVASSTVAADADLGASVAVSGVCLTVVERRAADPTSWLLAFDVSEETLARTALGRLRPGDPVNLERPVTLLGRLGGHLVQGHVDGVGTIEAVEPAGGGRLVQVRIPAGLERYVVEKGSVTVDGVSLTATMVRDGGFSVALVAFTLAATTLGTAAPGDPVNIEVDVMAKYVERLMSAAPRGAGPGDSEGERGR